VTTGKTPQCCGKPMREVAVDGLPEGLQRWVCDVCGNRRWHLHGREVDDRIALDFAREPQE
jgi:hypothetical protein